MIQKARNYRVDSHSCNKELCRSKYIEGGTDWVGQHYRFRQKINGAIGSRSESRRPSPQTPVPQTNPSLPLISRKVKTAGVPLPPKKQVGSQ